MRKLLTQSAVAVLLFAGVAAGNPPNPPSGAAAPKLAADVPCRAGRPVSLAAIHFCRRPLQP